MKKLYRFHLDWGRMGRLSGTFVADDQDVENATGKTIDFGEALGKHSQVSCPFDDKNITLEVLTDDQDFIEKFVKLQCATGRNPLDYLLCPGCRDILASPYTQCPCGWNDGD